MCCIAVSISEETFGFIEFQNIFKFISSVSQSTICINLIKQIRESTVTQVISKSTTRNYLWFKKQISCYKQHNIALYSYRAALHEKLGLPHLLGESCSLLCQMYLLQAAKRIWEIWIVLLSCCRLESLFWTKVNKYIQLHLINKFMKTLTKSFMPLSVIVIKKRTHVLPFTKPGGWRHFRIILMILFLRSDSFFSNYLIIPSGFTTWYFILFSQKNL